MKTVIAAVTLFLAPAIAHAQDTAQNRDACMGDAMSYCLAAIPDQTRIEACLRQNRARISPACQMALNGPAATRRTAKKRVRRAGT